MEFETFISAPRWKILEIIAGKASSPIEISKELKTSVAYVSQQLKLLEFAGIISKTKTGAVQKGQPRTLFSLKEDLAHITVLANHLPARKFIHLSDYHKAVLRIWLIENSEFHYDLQKIYFGIGKYLSEINLIFLDISKKPVLVIVSENKNIKNILSEIQKEGIALSSKIISSKEFSNYTLDKFYVIHDPTSILKEKKMKGGNL